MESNNTALSVRTDRKQQLVNLTSAVTGKIEECGIRNGILGIYCQHTTAALFVGEWQAALTDDVLEFLKRIVEEELPYRHNSPEFSDCERRNATSHLRSMLLNHSVLVPVVDGKPLLGQFQSVVFAEFDGPRERMLHVQVIGQ